MSVAIKENDKLCDIISKEYHLLQMMTRFGISLGVGEKTIKQVCEEAAVDTNTFLAVANYLKSGEDIVDDYIETVSVKSLIDYLENAHVYFLEFQLPAIRRKLLSAIDCSIDNKVAFLILKFFDEYLAEVRKHMAYENSKTFPYVKDLLKGIKATNYDISVYSRGHDAVEKKLQELKNIIIKYYKAGGDDTPLVSVLFDIFTCEADLHQHETVEDYLFVPAVKLLENKVAVNGAVNSEDEPQNVTKDETLSEREKEIVRCIVNGLTNKEVAEKLFISVNTVLTHRKNIARKLSIHSTAGLTIYAIANGIVNLEDVQI